MMVPKDVHTMCRILRDAGWRAWVVGGCTRDMLLGREVSDWDLATDARPEQVSEVFRRVIPTGIQHGTVTVLLRNVGYEVTTLRGDADPKASSRLMVRGDWRRPGPEVSPEFPRIANPDQRKVPAGNPRLQLALWLTDPSHPLTARTIVNRVWQYHFGRGLSATPSDFGVMGDEPTHPQLLDHLASRLTSRGWSLKDLHRQIVLSAVYRTAGKSPEGSSESWKTAVDADPENRLLARFPRRRLAAESIRDAMLAANESLNHEAGGPGVRPPLPKELIQTLKSGQ